MKKAVAVRKELRNNSKKVINSIRDYITESHNEWRIENGLKATTDFKVVAHDVLKQFLIEKGAFHMARFQNFVSRYYGSFQKMFIDYCQGLPSVIDCTYYLYYHMSPTDLLGDWLDQTQEERSKYDESESAEMISKLIYRELTREVYIQDLLNE